MTRIVNARGSALDQRDDVCALAHAGGKLRHAHTGMPTCVRLCVRTCVKLTTMPDSYSSQALTNQKHAQLNGLSSLEHCHWFTHNVACRAIANEKATAQLNFSTFLVLKLGHFYYRIS